MTQGLPRKFLHPRRGSRLHRLHIQYLCAGLFFFNRQHLTAYSSCCDAGRPTVAATRKTTNGVLINASPGRDRRSKEGPAVKKNRCHGDCTKARTPLAWRGGIKGAVRPHPAAARLLPGAQQPRRVPSRRKHRRVRVSARLAERDGTAIAMNKKRDNGWGGILFKKKKNTLKG